MVAKILTSQISLIDKSTPFMSINTKPQRIVYYNSSPLYILYGLNRRVAEIQIFEKTYLIVIKDETGLNFKINDSTLFLIGSYAQKLVASY